MFPPSMEVVLSFKKPPLVDELNTLGRSSRRGSLKTLDRVLGNINFTLSSEEVGPEVWVEVSTAEEGDDKETEV